MVAPWLPSQCGAPPNGVAAASLGHENYLLAECVWVHRAALSSRAAFQRIVLVTTIAPVYEWSYRKVC